MGRLARAAPADCAGTSCGRHHQPLAVYDSLTHPILDSFHAARTLTFSYLAPRRLTYSAPMEKNIYIPPDLRIKTIALKADALQFGAVVIHSANLGRLGPSLGCQLLVVRFMDMCLSGSLT